LAKELKKKGAKGELFSIQADVSNEEDIKRVVKWTRENLGGAHVLVNNAGVAPNSPLTSDKTFKVFQCYLLMIANLFFCSYN
jgi:NAD(P)-dependent dehydrogenase (short-subunit alcohol dehydrogenase family)